MLVKKVRIFILIFFTTSTLNVEAISPTQPILPSDNIQDPGSLSTPWGGCAPSDMNCYIAINFFTDETVEGLDYSTSTGILSLTSGYEIPTIASTTNWNSTLSTLSNSVLIQNGNSFGTTLTFGTNDSNDLVFNTSGVERMRIYTGGDVNITGSLTLGSQLADGQFIKSGDWTGLFDGQDGSYYLDRANQTGTQLALTISDFATSTKNLLSSTVTGLSYSTSTGVFSLTSGYEIPLTASTTEWVNKVSSQWVTNGANIYYSTGNVGIGVVTPNEKLQVTGGNIGTYGNGNGFVMYNLGQGNYSGNYEMARFMPVSNEFLFQTLQGGTGVGRNMRFAVGNASLTLVNASGNIGIGTTSPSAKFALTGTAGTGDIFAIASSTDSRILTVTSGGNMGLGVSSSLLGKLHIVEVGATRPNLYVVNTDNSANDLAQFWAQNLTLGVGINYDGIRQSATNGTLKLNANGTGKIYIGGTSSGNVAIGSNTTSSASKLTVAGNGSFGLNYYATAAPTGGLIVEGNVGIGTSTPFAKLSVKGSGVTTGSAFVTTDSNDNIRFSILDNGTVGVGGTITSATALTGSTLIVNNTASGQAALSVSGHDIPTLNMRSNSGNSVNAGTLAFSTSGGSEFFNQTFNASDNNYYFNYGGTTIGSLSSTGWGFGTTAFDNSATVDIRSTAEQIRSGYDASNYWNATTNSVGLTSFNAVGSGSAFVFSDNVGIGTTTPGSILTLGSGQIELPMGTNSAPSIAFSGDLNTGIYSSTADTLSFASNGSLMARINASGLTLDSGILRTQALGTAANPVYTFVTDSNTGIFGTGSDVFGISTAGLERLRIDASGNVGIGTTTPTQKLSVIGNGQFTAVGSGAYAFDLNLASDGTLTTSASDERLKQNIMTISSTSTLEKISLLRPVTFDWKSNESHDIGLIAQEVEQIFPELVFTNSTDGYKGVNYSRFTALLISSIQELSGNLNKVLSWFKDDKFDIQGDVCVEEVCITKQQFKQMLIDSQSGQNSTQTSTQPETPPTETEPVVVEETPPEPDTEPEPVVVEETLPGPDIETTPITPIITE